mgnify:CR=1 FL=1
MSVKVLNGINDVSPDCIGGIYIICPNIPCGGCLLEGGGGGCTCDVTGPCYADLPPCTIDCGSSGGVNSIPR